MSNKLNRVEAAEYCGVSVITIDRALANKKIRHFRIGRRVIFSSDQLDEFLASCEQPVSYHYAKGDKNRKEGNQGIEV